MKIGDKVLIDVLGNGVYNEFEFVSEGVEEDTRWQEFKGVGVYIHYPDIEDYSNFKFHDGCPKCGAMSNDGFCPEEEDCQINAGRKRQ